MFGSNCSNKRSILIITDRCFNHNEIIFLNNFSCQKLSKDFLCYLRNYNSFTGETSSVVFSYLFDRLRLCAVSVVFPYFFDRLRLCAIRRSCSHPQKRESVATCETFMELENQIHEITVKRNECLR